MMTLASLLLVPALAMNAPRGVPGNADRVEVRRVDFGGHLDSFLGTIWTESCQPVQQRERRQLVSYWDCLWPLSAPGDKDWLYEVRACGGNACSEWKREPRLTCQCWEGADGCPTAILTVEPCP